tara:strand:+ start:57 stop:896 length:840 start_codon:yes stop_codon:yes gene_type:complete
MTRDEVIDEVFKEHPDLLTREKAEELVNSRGKGFVENYGSQLKEYDEIPGAYETGDMNSSELAKGLNRLSEENDEEESEEDGESFLDRFMPDYEGINNEQELVEAYTGESGVNSGEEEALQNIPDQPETEDERYRRQVDTFNGMRNHNFDSEIYDQGQDPQSMENRATDQEMTKIVEALQRQAFERGNPSDASGMPLGMGDGTSVDPNNIQNAQLRAMTQLGNASPGGGMANIDIMQALKNSQLQPQQLQTQPFRGIGGSNSSGSYGGGNPFGGNPYGG